MFTSPSNATLDSSLLLKPKAIYFAVGALNYSFYVFRMKFFRRYFGFEEAQYGLVQTIWNVASFAGVGLWGNLADFLNAHRVILVGLCLALGTCFEGVLLKEVLDPKYWVYLAAVVFGIYGLLIGGLLPLTDGQMLRLLECRYKENSKLYGKQALFGMLAYAAISLGLGRLLDRLGIEIMLWIVPATSIFAAGMVAWFGHQSTEMVAEKEDQEPTNTTGTTSFAVYLKTLGQTKFLLFLLVILATGLGRQTLAIFLPHYLSTELGLTDSQIGDAYFVGILFSILLYSIAPHILSRLGIWPMLFIGQGFLIARLSIYAFLTPAPWMIPLIELLNGMAYSFTHLAAVQETSQCAPPGWDAAFQAAYGCVHVQFPATVCSLVGGYFYEQHKGRWLLTAALIAPTLSFILLGIFLVIRSSNK